jgi:predicted Zn finger-like uncharacterized protein
MTHTCPHCGAVYEVTWNKEPPRDKDTVDYPLCGKEMASPIGSRAPSFRLLKLPEGKTDND